jgi:hypothetical protein
MSLPGRRPTAVLASALAIATVVTALSLSGQTVAQARKAPCPPSLGTHPKRGAAACLRFRRKSEARARSKARGHHAKHQAKSKQPKSSTPSPLAPSQTKARCEDGSISLQAPGGSFACGDGSEPSCEDGSNPVISSDHSMLLCNGASKGSGSGEPACEAGGSPTSERDGGLSCQEGFPPICEKGSAPTLSGQALTVVCSEGPNAEAEG